MSEMNFGHKKLYIDGQLIDASNGQTHEVICPADEESIAQIAWASKEDTLLALRAAQEGFEHWSSLSLAERRGWIMKLREKLIENRDFLRKSIMYEMGKVWEGTDEDLTSIINSLEFYADEIETRTDIKIPDKEGSHSHKVIYQPLGVVVAFLAYNFPLLNLGFKLGPALAAGCSIIIKPSEYSPLSAYIIGEICHEINFPKGVINILCGDVEEVGIPLCESKIPKLITMIGSTETAQKLISQSSKTSLKRFSMECGGNAPFIVFEDADLPLAIEHGSALKTGNSGQICVAPNRFFIHTSVIDAFTEGMLKKFQASRLGFGRAHKPDMGPMTNKQSVEKVHAIVKEAISQGGEVRYGGKPLEGPGFYFEPTIIRLEDRHAEVLQK
ncbi:MAG: aldehyde dehydrogenase family protein, partial [Bacteroidota bacterium]